MPHSLLCNLKPCLSISDGRDQLIGLGFVDVHLLIVVVLDCSLEIGPSQLRFLLLSFELDQVTMELLDLALVCLELLKCLMVVLLLSYCDS